MAPQTVLVATDESSAFEILSTQADGMAHLVLQSLPELISYFD